MQHFKAMTSFQPQLWERLRSDVIERAFDWSGEFIWLKQRRVLNFVNSDKHYFFTPQGEQSAEWNFWLDFSWGTPSQLAGKEAQLIEAALLKNRVERVCLLDGQMQLALGAVRVKKWRVVFRGDPGGTLWSPQLTGRFMMAQQSYRFHVGDDLMLRHFGAEWRMLSPLDVPASALWAFVRELWANENSDLREAARFAVLSRDEKLGLGKEALAQDWWAANQELQLVARLFATPKKTTQLSLVASGGSPAIEVGLSINGDAARDVSATDRKMMLAVARRFLDGARSPADERLRLYLLGGNSDVRFELACDSAHERLESALHLRDRWRDWPQGLFWLEEKLGA